MEAAGGSGERWGAGGRCCAPARDGSPFPVRRRNVEEERPEVSLSKESPVCQPLLCYGMSEKHGNETGAANTSDLVKFAENPCHVLPDKGQEPSGCFYPAV